MALHPYVQLAIEEMAKHDWSVRDLEAVSGVSRGAFMRWKKGGDPRFGNLVAVLNTLGFDVALIRREGRPPKPPSNPEPPPIEPPSIRKRVYFGPTKLTQEQVDDIRRREMPQKAYAERYAVTPALISMIQTGKRWPDPLDRA